MLQYSTWIFTNLSFTPKKVDLVITSKKQGFFFINKYNEEDSGKCNVNEIPATILKKNWSYVKSRLDYLNKRKKSVTD